MDNPRCLHIYIPSSEGEKGKEVQVAPFKEWLQEIPHATSIYILLAELCHTAIPGAGQAGQDSEVLGWPELGSPGRWQDAKGYW